jgi:8-oxo-dGTP pyrophosphatase MutT (NUDIX family)
MMHRYHLLQMLERYLAVYPQEEPMVARVQMLVERHADCFERTCRPGHITGAAWVVSADHARVALVHHRKLGRWLQPGGHADGDGDVASVAWKEATEETGLTGLTMFNTGGTLVPLDVDVHQIPPRYDAVGQLIEDAHEHHDIRFLFITSDHSLTTSDESHDVRWFDARGVRALTSEPSVLRLLEKAMAWLT